MRRRLEIALAAIAVICASGCARGAAPQRAPNPTETTGDPGSIIVEVVGLRNEEGQVLIALFRSSDGFPDDRDKAQASAAVRIRDRTARHEFEYVPPGEFAVGVLHDENENFEMDTNIFGIPQEGYGASRNPAPRLGPPRYRESRLILPAGERVLVRIQVVYP